MFNTPPILLKCKCSGCPFTSSSTVGLRVHSKACQFRKRSYLMKRNLPSQPVEKDTFQRLKHSRIFDSQTRNEYTFSETTLPELASNIQSTERPSVGSHFRHPDLHSPLISKFMMSLSNLAVVAGKKQVNGILNILNDPEFPVQECRELVRTADDCLAYVDNKCRSQLSSDGFREVMVEDEETGLTYTYFKKDPTAVLAKQIALANHRNCFFSPINMQANESPLYTNPMRAELGQTASVAVQRAVQSSLDDKVIWKTMEHDGRQSFVGFVQIYSDKSATTLKARGFSFYPIHLVLLNFSTDLRSQLITSAATVVGYLPVGFDDSDSSLNESQGKADARYRKQRRQVIHNTIEEIFSPLAAIAKIGFDCTDSDNVSRLCHVALGSYCCDIPEAKDMTGVRYGGKTKASCFRCLIPTESMSSSVEAEMRCLEDTLETIRKADSLREEAAKSAARCDWSSSKQMNASSSQLLKEKSLTGHRPVLHRFPFVGIAPSLEYYQLFSYEPLHNLHLGISKMLKKVIVERLKDDDLTSSAVRYANGNPKPFPSIRGIVLSGANQILKQMQIESSARNLRIDFSSSHKGWRYNGFFSEDGIVGMLEARDHKSMDMVFPFIAAYIDRCYGEIEQCPTTRVSSLYSTILFTLARKGDRCGWTPDDLSLLRTHIHRFKHIFVDLFARYQPSGMGTLKFHLLDHLVDDIKRLGSISVMDAGPFEYSHTLFKQQYRGTSKRRHSAMKESIRQINRSEYCGLQMGTPKVRSNYVTRNLSDGPILARDGQRVSISELLTSCAEHANTRDQSTVADKIVQDVGRTETLVFVESLKRWWQEKYSCCIPTNRRLIERITSAYVENKSVPVAEDLNETGTKIRFRNSGPGYERRLVSTRNFCGNRKLRQDCVLVSKRDEEGEFVRVARVLLFIRAKPFSSSENSGDYPFMFVRYFNPLPLSDEIDRQLGCVKLQWASKDNCASSTSDWLGLEPISALRGGVHVVTTDYQVHGLRDEPNLNEKVYYVNRFIWDSGAKKVQGSDDENP